MPTSPFERQPSPDAFRPETPDSTRRALHNIRPKREALTRRNLDQLADAYDASVPTIEDLSDADFGFEPPRLPSLPRPEPTSLDAETLKMHRDAEDAEDEEYLAFLRAEKQKKADELKHPGLTPARMESVLRNRRADQIQYGSGDFLKRTAGMTAEELRNDRSFAQLTAAAERERERKTLEQNLARQEQLVKDRRQDKMGFSAEGRARLDRVLNRYSAGADTDRSGAEERIARQREESLARHQERLDAARTNSLHKAFDAAERIGAHASELPARQAAIRAEALRETNSAPLLKTEKHPSYIDDEVLEGERDTHAWELAQSGHQFQNPEDAAAALRGFARANNKPTFAERADGILRDHQIAKGAGVQESFIKPSNGRVEDLDSMMMDPSAFEDRTPDRRGSKTLSPDLADMLDDMDAALGRASKRETATNKPESKQEVEQFEATPYMPGPSAQEIINTKKGELDKARQDLHAWRESLRIIQEDINKDEDAFEKMHGAHLGQSAMGTNSIFTRARMGVENLGWRLIGQKNRAADVHIAKFKRDNEAALKISARLAEQMELVKNLEADIQVREQEARGEYPEFNEEKDRERGRFRAAAMRGGFRRRTSDHAPETSLPIGDIGAPVGSKKLELDERHSVLRNRDAEQAAAASASTFEQGGFDADEAREMAAELNGANTEPETSEEELNLQERFAEEMADGNMGNLGERWGKRFKNDPVMLENIMGYLPLFRTLEDTGVDGLGSNFNRLIDLPLEQARKLIEKKVNTYLDKKAEKEWVAAHTRSEVIDTICAMYASMREDDPSNSWKKETPSTFKYVVDRNTGKVKTIDIA